MMLFQSVSVNQ